MRRLAAVLGLPAVVVALAAVGAPVPASAGGTVLYPVHDRYEVGDEAVMVAHSIVRQPVDLSAGPHRAYIQAGDRRLFVGELMAERTGERPGWTALRISIRFTVPELAPDEYWLGYCVGPCDGKSEPYAPMGDVLGGPVFVGVDPPRPLERDWPLDEPEIANLDDDAVLPAGHEHQTTAGAFRRGEPPVPVPVFDTAPPARPADPPATTPPTFARTSVVLASGLDPAPNGGGQFAGVVLLVVVALVLVIVVAAMAVSLVRGVRRRRRVRANRNLEERPARHSVPRTPCVPEGDDDSRSPLVLRR